jgi:hypothetical protein
MIQSWVVEHSHHRVHGARFNIVGAINETLNACMYQRSRAHRARFNCNKQLATTKAVVADGSCGITQSDHFGVGRRIGIRDIAIKTSTYDPSAVNDNRADWNLTGLKRTLSPA